MYNPKHHKVKPSKELPQEASPAWANVMLSRNFHIANLLLGTVNVSGFCKKPNYLGALMQPFVLLGNDLLDEEQADPTVWQQHLPGSGLGYLSSLVAFEGHEVFQEKVWSELKLRLTAYRTHGLQTLYSPSSFPVDSIDGAGYGLGGNMPNSIGIFLGHCRRQLSLRNHLGIQVDWIVPVSSYDIPAWETHTIPVTPTVEALEDLVLPAIGEYLALMLMVPSILKGKAEMLDEALYLQVMSASVLANLKSFDKLTTHLEVQGHDLPDLTEFRLKLDFAERFVDAVAEEIVAKVSEPGNMQAMDITPCTLLKAYFEAADAYGTEHPYKAFNRGVLAKGVQRHQADVWKCHPDFIQSRVERTPARKIYRFYFSVATSQVFAKVASYAYQRSYPESFVSEVVDRLEWASWKGKMGRSKSLQHGVWQEFEQKVKDFI